MSVLPCKSARGESAQAHPEITSSCHEKGGYVLVKEAEAILAIEGSLIGVRIGRYCHALNRCYVLQVDFQRAALRPLPCTPSHQQKPTHNYSTHQRGHVVGGAKGIAFIEIDIRDHLGRGRDRHVLHKVGRAEQTLLFRSGAVRNQQNTSAGRENPAVRLNKRLWRRT